MKTNYPLIETEQLSKRYGAKPAVEAVSFQVQGGEIFGFLGPNGAGKTTTIKMIVGLLKPTTGIARVGGFDVQAQPIQAKSITGYVPDEPNLYAKLTGRELLRFVGNLYQMDRKQVDRRIESWHRSRRPSCDQHRPRGSRRRQPVAGDLFFPDGRSAAGRAVFSG